MKSFVCEICQSVEVVKRDGSFCCVACGTMYSTEEVKKQVMGGVGATVVKIDQSVDYDNLVKIAEESFSDFLYDSAYEYCLKAVAINSGDYKTMALQGLSVLGKEKLNGDIPVACINSLGRALLSISESPVSFSGKIDAFLNVKKMIGSVCTYKMEEFDLEIKELNGQKVFYSPGVEKALSASAWLSASGDTLQSLGGKPSVHAQGQARDAKSELEKVRNDRIHNEALDMRISTIRDLKRKISDFLDSQNAKIDVFISEVKEQEREYNDERRVSYWEDHKSERESLESELRLLNEDVRAVDASIFSKVEERDCIEAELRSLRSPAEKIKEDIKDKIRELENKRNGLGVFKAKEKKQLTEEIAELFSQIPDVSTIEKQLSDLRELKRPQLNKLDEEISSLEVIRTDHNTRISVIVSEFNKER